MDSTAAASKISQSPDFSSPKRLESFTRNQQTTPTSPPFRDVGLYPWNWGEQAHEIELSPASSCGSPEESNGDRRRGRPRADSIGKLINTASRTDSDIRCQVCQRVFPREKSLQAHMRTHTGERPYICDYPRCGRAFCQSGQLKTHQRLHTGEKPFICSVEGCRSRFTHANRHCSEHPLAVLKRVPLEASLPPRPQNAHDQAVCEWLENYAKRQQEKTPKRSRFKRSLDADIENHPNPHAGRPVPNTAVSEKRVSAENPAAIGMTSPVPRKHPTLEHSQSPLLQRLRAPHLDFTQIRPALSTLNPRAPSAGYMPQPRPMNRQILGARLLTPEESDYLGVKSLDGPAVRASTVELNSSSSTSGSAAPAKRAALAESTAPTGRAGNTAPTGRAALAGSTAPTGRAGSTAPTGRAGSTAPTGRAALAGSTAPTERAAPTGSAVVGEEQEKILGAMALVQLAQGCLTMGTTSSISN